MKYSDEIVSVAIIYIPSVINTGSSIENLIQGAYTHIHIDSSMIS
jgi:hypothetical protein